MEYFYWLRVKNSSHLHTELSLDYLNTKFYLESTASFIHISSIASVKPFLIAWLREYCTFSDSSMVSLGQNTPSMELFCKKNHVLLSNFFPYSNIFFIRLFLANTPPPPEKNGGSPSLFIRKGAFISLSSLVSGKSLRFCMRTRSCACANDVKIVRSRDAQCNTKESP